MAVHGDRFVVVETDKTGSLDELRQPLQGSPEPESNRLSAGGKALPYSVLIWKPAGASEQTSRRYRIPT